MTRTSYNEELFRAWNLGVRAARFEYQVTLAKNEATPAKPPARYNEVGNKICGDENCFEELPNVRSRLCEAHRKARQRAQRKASKHRRRTNVGVSDVHVPSV